MKDVYITKRKVNVESYELMKDTIWGIVKSESNPDAIHTVNIKFGNDQYRGFYCDCESGYYKPGIPCKHVQELLQTITRDELVSMILKSISINE